MDCPWLQQGGTLLCPLNWMLGQLQRLRLLHLLVLGSSSAGAEYTACSLKPSPRHRLEKERAAAKSGYTALGSKFYYTCKPIRSSGPLTGYRPRTCNNSQNSHNSQSLTQQTVKPPPPQRGTPGVALATVEESTPQTSFPNSLLGWGARARASRRRFY